MTETATTATTATTYSLVYRGRGRATHISGTQKHTTWCCTDWNAAHGMQYTSSAGKGLPTCKTCQKLAGLI